MSDQHTPAPWLIRRVNEKAPDITYIQTGEGYLEGEIAVIYHSEHSLANARLIAAAPDLLSACRELLKNIEEFGFEYISMEHPLVTGVPLARAAIAKAEGK